MKRCISGVKMKGVRSLSVHKVDVYFRRGSLSLHSDKKTDDLPLDAAELLRVAHDLAEVDVEHVTAVFDHDVVVVAVADAQNERGHTPAGAGVKEVHYSLQVRRETSTPHTETKSRHSEEDVC